MAKTKLYYYIVIFFISIVFYSYLSSMVSANSDNMSSLLIAKDFAEGNYRLSGWFMSTQSYFFSDIVWTAMIIKLFGFYPILVHILPGIFYAICAACALILVYPASKYSFYIIAPIILVPTYFTIANSAQLNIHNGIYFLSSILLVLFYRRGTSINWLLIIILSIICGAYADSDKLLLITFVLPVLMSSLLHRVLCKDKEMVKFIVFSLLTIVFYKTFGMINDVVFKYSTPGIGLQGFASIEGVYKNIGIFIDGFLLYFGINALNSYEPLNIFRLFCIAVFVILYLYASIKKWNASFIDSILFFISIIPCAAFIFSTVAIDVNSTRYIYYSFFAASILIARSINLTRTKHYSIPFLLIWATLNFFSFNANVETEESYYQRLGVFLKSHGLENGYGEFWKASIVSGFGDVHISPVIIQNNIMPMYWLSKDEWYKKNSFFFITRKDSEKDIAISQFGNPKKELNFEGMQILVWEEMVLPPYGISIHRIYKDALPTHVGNYIDGEVHSTGKSGYLLFGPYKPLKSGNYKFVIRGLNAKSGDSVDIIDFSRSAVLFGSELKFNENGIFSADIVLPEDYSNVEIRVKTNGNPELIIKGYTIVSK